jgi:hypothetical protein
MKLEITITEARNTFSSKEKINKQKKDLEHKDHSPENQREIALIRHRKKFVFFFLRKKLIFY